MQNIPILTEKFFIYGVDDTTRDIVTRVFKGPEELEKCGCLGFIGTDPYMKEFMSFKVFLMKDISSIEYTKICVVCKEDYSVVRDHFVFGYKMASDIIKPSDWLIRIKILCGNHPVKVNEESVVFEQLRNCDDLDDFCGYCSEKPQKYLINWDSEYDMPYAVFEGKRIYYPRNHKFLIENGNQYVEGLEYEQQKGSPHLYLTDKININEGDVVVDAGVCEGNFSIKIVDKCKKLYLIEPDKDWYYPLRLTFKDYMHKVVFCYKYLSDTNDESSITLDELIQNEKIDFLKMDIEGSETDALLGANNTFKNNDIKCSICSYHKHGDEKRIRELLKWYGYDSDTSEGYMIYLHDPDRYRYCEMRRGIVYGWKGQH